MNILLLTLIAYLGIFPLYFTIYLLLIGFINLLKNKETSNITDLCIIISSYYVYNLLPYEAASILLMSNILKYIYEDILDE